LSVYRKFLWTDELFRRFRSFALKKYPALEAKRVKGIVSLTDTFRADMYLCLWLSTLYVVVEGWTRLRERHPTITPMLRSPNKALLREFRNAVLHPTYWNDARLGALIKGSEGSIEWAADLTRALRQFFSPIRRTDLLIRRISRAATA